MLIIFGKVVNRKVLVARRLINLGASLPTPPRLRSELSPQSVYNSFGI